MPSRFASKHPLMIRPFLLLLFSVPLPFSICFASPLRQCSVTSVRSREPDEPPIDEQTLQIAMTSEPRIDVSWSCRGFCGSYVNADKKAARKGNIPMVGYFCCALVSFFRKKEETSDDACQGVSRCCHGHGCYGRPFAER